MRLIEADTANPAKRVRDLLRSYGQTYAREAGIPTLLHLSSTRDHAAAKAAEES
jgi:hypothetical protein